MSRLKLSANDILSCRVKNPSNRSFANSYGKKITRTMGSRKIYGEFSYNGAPLGARTQSGLYRVATTVSLGKSLGVKACIADRFISESQTVRNDYIFLSEEISKVIGKKTKIRYKTAKGKNKTGLAISIKRKK